MSLHQEKLAATIHRAVTQVLSRGLSDPRLEGSLITITTAELAVDGANMTLGASVLPEKNESKVIAALKHSAPHIRREVGELVRTRHMPQLEFVLDKGLKKQAGIIEALGKVSAERENEHKGANGETTPGDGV